MDLIKSTTNCQYCKLLVEIDSKSKTRDHTCFDCKLIRRKLENHFTKLEQNIIFKMLKKREMFQVQISSDI